MELTSETSFVFFVHTCIMLLLYVSHYFYDLKVLNGYKNLRGFLFMNRLEFCELKNAKSKIRKIRWQ